MIIQSLCFYKFKSSSIHVISPYFGGSSLYFVYFSENLPTEIFRISYISYTSPYLEFQISLPNFKNSLLCLIILPIWKTKSPYFSSGMYHMYEFKPLVIFCGCTARFVSEVDGSLEDRFSHDLAHNDCNPIMSRYLFTYWG